MYQIPVYRAEIEAGVAESVRAAGSLAFACAVRPWDAERARAEHSLALSRLRTLFPEQARAALNDLDLHFLQTILVTTGWNRNDDVFDPLEVWVARHSPEHKPFNYEHDCANIIGHIITNWVMGDDGNLVAEDTTVDDLPKKFHVATGAVLYKYWEKPELQERMDRILAEIAKGEWYVSMECLFKGFDYALTAPDASMRVVARNEQTAFLTKHLRSYGGTGNYGDYKVGRLLRNILFSGKGLVRKPANPESVILSETEPFSASTATLVSEFSQVSAEQVYSPVAEQDSEQAQERNQQMAIELEAMQKQLDALKSENEQLKAALRDNDVKEFKTKAEAAEAAKTKVEELLKSAQEALTKAQAEVEAAKSESETVKAKLTETETALTETKDELKGLYAEQRKNTRIATAKEKLKLDDADAAEYVTANEALSDEAFTKQVELLVKTIAKQTPAPHPEKKTPAPTPDQQTPAANAAEEVAENEQVQNDETDDEGEVAAASADLNTVEAGKNNAALSTTETDSGVNDVAQAIAAYFGAEAEQE